MSQRESEGNEVKIPQINYWTGDKKGWTAYQNAVISKSMTTQNLDIVIDAGECVNETFQSLRVKQQTFSSVSSKVEDYSNDMW